MSSWQVEERARARHARERVLFTKKQAGDVRVCLVYPNHYRVAMGNLGFQAVYEIFDRHPDVVCERAFLPDDEDAAFVTRGEPAQPRVAHARSRLRRDRVLDLVRDGLLARRSPPRLDRSAAHQPRTRRPRPLVMAGGPAVFLNPEPLADFIDLFLIGEAEEMLPEFLTLLSECAQHPAPFDGLRQAQDSALSAILWQSAARVAGTYVPSFYEPTYDDAELTAVDYHGPGETRVERRLIWDLNKFATTTRVLSDEAVFGDMMLVEASRGCQWGCRFCAAGYMYRPIRTRGVDALAQSVRAGLEHRKTIGLVGAEMASVPGVDVLSEIAAGGGGRLSPSSLKADCVTPRLAAALARGRNRSVTIAPEAGSERMRRVINKNLSENRHPACRGSVGWRRRQGSQALFHGRAAERSSRKMSRRSPT